MILLILKLNQLFVDELMTKEVAIKLVDFSVFYNQDNTGEVEEKLRSGGSKNCY